MLSRRVVNCFLLLCAFAWLAVTGALASEYHGQVTFNGLPVPGTAVTATQDGKKLSVVTDDQGIYEFADLPDGKWTIAISMTGFAPVTQDVTIPPGGPVSAIEIKLLTLDQIRAAAKPLKVETAAPAIADASTPAAPASGATPAAAGGKKPATPAKGAAAGNEQANAAPPPPPPSPSDSQSNDGLLINGSVNNAATSQYAMSQAFGNNRTNGRSMYNYGLMFTLDNSKLDANSYSLAGIPTPKQSYNNFTLGAQFGGPIRIPNHWNPRNFRVDFLNYQRVQRSVTSTLTALVPTQAQRFGDLTGIGTPVYDPATGHPYGNTNCSPQLLAINAAPTACIPLSELSTKNSQAAQALLNFYPLPNVAGAIRNNFQVQTASNTRQDGVQTRLSKPFGNKDYVYGNFNLQSIRQGTNTLFGFHDINDQFNLSFGANWNHRFTQRLFVNLGYNFSRSRTLGTPFFANRLNIEGQANILGVDTSPINWGPPSLNFSSGFFPLSDTNSSRNRTETNGVSLDVQWNRSRHIIDVGGDFRRQQFNYFSQSIPRGSFQFTGAATNGGGVANAGSDFADFLLGVPDTSSLSYGNPDKYLRQSVYDAYAQDDFRVNPELSIKYGVRWEYGAPVTETQNRLANLDFATGSRPFSAETPVLAKSPTGALSGMSYPNSLVRPDKIGFAPNVGIAWRPISGSSLLIRSGYQITHETSVYTQTALLMATQSPLATSPNLNNAVCPLTLTAAFPACPSITADNFALDPNFRVGYVQTWQVSAQRDLPGSLQAIVTYTGIKGTRGVQEFAPNTYAYGAVNPCPSCPVGFLYRTSNGNSTREAGIAQLRRRLRNGFTASLTYTFSKAIDDDYAFAAAQGSSASPQVAQDWQHPNSQRGLSTFDQRHVFALQMQYTTGMGLGGHTLLSGWRGVLYKEWSVIANLSTASGTPETPTYAATVPGTAFSNIFRADYTGKSLSSPSPGFNPLAFAAPTAGAFGNARRDSIPGPDQFSLNATLRRDFRLHDRYTLGAEIDANNVLNHVVYTSWYNTISPSVTNPQFGSPSNTNSMRSVTITLRLRN